MNVEVSGSSRKHPLIDIALSQLKVGTLGFGGPLATMAFMRDELVLRKKLVTQDRYLEGLAVVKLLPGPVSCLLSIFLGRQVGGWLGGLVSGIAYIIPAFLMMLAVVLLKDLLPPDVLQSHGFRSVMQGVQVAVLAVVLHTCWKLLRDAQDRAYRGQKRVGVVTVIAFGAAGAALLGCPELLILVGAGLCGVLLIEFSRTGTLRVDPLTVGFVFFTAGLTVFGTGYMVLPHLQRVLVDQKHWISGQDFLDSIAWGNLTPGPIVIASTYMGYVMGGWSVSLAATLGIFAGPFVLMLTLGPLVEKILGRPWLEGVLLGIIPAVAATVAAGLVPLSRGLVWNANAFLIGSVSLVLAFRRWSVVRIFAVAAILGWGMNL